MTLLFSIFLLADIRFVDEGGVVEHVHTCNGTAVASTRALITLMETHQNVSEEHLLNSESGVMGTRSSFFWFLCMVSVRGGGATVSRPLILSGAAL